MPDHQPQMLEVEDVEQRQKRLGMYSNFPLVLLSIIFDRQKAFLKD
jgi:hypothetical protein